MLAGTNTAVYFETASATKKSKFDHFETSWLTNWEVRRTWARWPEGRAESFRYQCSSFYHWRSDRI